jgi:hypothetical protein
VIDGFFVGTRKDRSLRQLLQGNAFLVGAAAGCDLLICAITEHKTPRAFLFN